MSKENGPWTPRHSMPPKSLDWADAAEEVVRPLDFSNMAAIRDSMDDLSANRSSEKRNPRFQNAQSALRNAQRGPKPTSVAPASGSVPPAALADAKLRAETFARAAIDLTTAKAQVLATLEEQLIELAVAIASVLVEQKVEADPHVLTTLAHTALAPLGDPRKATLRASKEAYAAIMQVFGEASMDVSGIKVEVILDPSLHGLGCIAENGDSHVDGRISERLRAVQRALDEERRRQTQAGAP